MSSDFKGFDAIDQTKFEGLSLVVGIFIDANDVVIQGFGNVGSHAAKFMHESEFKIIAISDVTGGYFNPEGIDIPAALKHVIKHKALEGLENVRKITNEELLCLECDLLIPAALGGVITMDNVKDIKARYIIEGANGPIDADADAQLESRGVIVLPDILANAGGVTVSYFEWVQNLQRFHWSEREVISKLETQMAAAFDRLISFAEARKCGHRVAALALGIKEVADVKKTRGLYP